MPGGIFQEMMSTDADGKSIVTLGSTKNSATVEKLPILEWMEAEIV